MIYNLDKKTYLAEKAFWAESHLSRLIGLMGCRRFPAAFDALIFDRCNAVHGCFMLMRIDLVFVSADFKIIGLKENFAPFTLAGCRKAAITVELPKGIIRKSRSEIGDKLNLNMLRTMELSDENILCQWN